MLRIERLYGIVAIVFCLFPVGLSMTAEDKSVMVWRLEDEGLGILLRNVLEDEGIHSEIRSEQIPWMDGIMKAARGYWGDLMVLDRDAARAREIIRDYLEQGSAGDTSSG